MKNLYKNYLFNKNILVNEEAKKSENIFEALFSIAHFFNIRIVEGESLADLNMVQYLSRQLGTNVPAPFYTGFPQSVRDLSTDQLVFDQFVHYTITYGFGNFSEAGHSLIETFMERDAFRETAAVKDFAIITEEEAIHKIGEYVGDLLLGSHPLNEEQYSLVSTYIGENHCIVKKCASKNTAIRLLVDLRDIHYAAFLMMSDVLKVVEELNFREYGNENVTKLNLRNQDRKFITRLINELFRLHRCDIRNCYERKAIWCGLLYHIHYQAKEELAEKFVAGMRGKENLSVYSEFEKALTGKEIRAAVQVLKSEKGSGAVLRNLDYIISRCGSEKEIAFVLDNIETSNAIVLLQLFIKYSANTSFHNQRIFKFTKYNRLHVHMETEEEQRRRKSHIAQNTADTICQKVDAELHRILKNRLGKVYISPDMKNFALPLQETTSQGGYGVLARGSRIHIEEGKKIRAFTYWEKVDDIDLSVMGMDEAGHQEEYSWRTMTRRQSKAITYSGDETSGYNGGSEYFDIDIEAFKKEHPSTRYLIFSDNVYFGGNFNECYCKAGYMTRDVEDSGEIYEPKTVQSSFIVNSHSSFAYLFGIDLSANDFVWLNAARYSNASVAGETSFQFLIDYFHVTSIMNVASFFKMMAAEVVDNPEAADVIVSNDTYEKCEKAETIRSYDFERIMALMNGEER